MISELSRLVRLLGLLAISSAMPAQAAPGPGAKVAEGRLAGVEAGGLHVFKGIPFARPPVGALRWKPPLPAAHWPGVREARAFGPSCIQPLVPRESIYADDPAAMSEDCLTLNVWAPAKARKAAVIVWVHGGSLRIGGSAEPLFDGANFARRGVVFVSINYRLGVLGWMAHPGLSSESPQHASGNYGLLDQVAALRWVKANIAAFGGDPGEVTVMGESAGALSVSYLLTSPLARGLFVRAISESTNTRAVPELSRPAFGLPSAEATGARLGTLEALRATEPKALDALAGKAGFVPQGTVDGWALPEQVVDAFDKGHQAKIPLLAGFNSGEVKSQRALLPPAPVDAAAYEAAIRRGYGDLAPAFLRLYPASDIPGSMLATLRDAVYGWATERMVRAQSVAGLPAYLYLFDHCYPAAAARDLCGFHASELPFVFGNLGPGAAMTPNWPRPEGPAAQALSAAMLDYWTSFAKTGVPASPGNPAWLPYRKGEAYLRFAGLPIAEHDLLPGMFEMQEELVRRRRAAGEQWFTNVGVAAPAH